MAPDPVLFRAYDIRGTYGRTLRDRDAYAIGRAAALMLREGGGRCMAVGRDGRLSSPALEAALVQGLLHGGVEVLRIGPGPTPMLYYAEASMPQADGGIQVTGSHNPRDDNGFKIVMGGAALYGAQIARLGALAAAVSGEEGAFEIGPAPEPIDIGKAYVERLLEAFSCLSEAERQRLGRFRIGWDAGNGAAGPVLEALAARLPGEHHLLYTAVDGHFPHHHPDPSLPENLTDLCALVAAKRLDFGVAFDGDGDRIVVVDGRGRAIMGDQLLAMLAQDLLLDRPGALILGDVKSSQAAFDAIEAAGGQVAMGAAGHSLIKSTMKQIGAALAGETTGHIFYADRFYGVDDALYAALRFMAALARRGSSVADWFDTLPRSLSTPELRFAVEGARKLAVVAEVAARLEAEGARVNKVDGLRVMREGGWWLLRASNTQEMLTARAESGTEEGLAALVAELDAQLALSGVLRT